MFNELRAKEGGLLHILVMTACSQCGAEPTRNQAIYDHGINDQKALPTQHQIKSPPTNHYSGTISLRVIGRQSKFGSGWVRDYIFGPLWVHRARVLL